MAQADPLEKVRALAAVNGLDAPGLKPWHLHLTYLAPTAPEQDGSVEEGWAAPDRWRQEWTNGGKTHTVVQTSEGRFVSTEGSVPGSAAQLMMERLLHPIADVELEGAVLQEKTVPVGSGELHCLMLAQPLPGLSDLPLGLFPTYCLQQDKLLLSRLGVVTDVAVQRMSTFQGHNVPTRLEVNLGKTLSVDGKVEALAGYTPEDAEFDTTGLTKGAPGTIRVSGGVTQGNQLTSVPPSYPEHARQLHLSGSVVLQAKIGTDGRIHRLQVVSSPNPEFSVAALAAVEQWTYRPYLLAGLPVEVNTTVTVNFNARGNTY